jgi:predicted DNA-binding WGR domain protein
VDLEFVEGTSSKFWRAKVDGTTVTVNYGRIGTTGQTQPKDFGDVGAAQKEYDKLVREKRKKGYVDAGGGGGAPPDDNDDDDDSDNETDDDAPAVTPAARPATPVAPARPPGTRLVLEAGTRKVETYVSLDGKTVRMEAIETYASPDAAKKAHDRLKKQLAGEGYQEK